MSLWFFVSVSGMIAVTPLNFLSVEHLKLQRRYGREKGIRIGETLGLISGWVLFLFWMGIWISPQPRFTVPIIRNPSATVSFVGFPVPFLHLLICVSFLMPGAWLGIKGVSETSLRVAETHRTEAIVTTGVYSIVRHPQYLGGLLAHGGISFLLSASYSLLSTPLMAALIYLISRKEEEELIREFGEEYEDYMKNVPMFLPRFARPRRER